MQEGQRLSYRSESPKVCNHRLNGSVGPHSSNLTGSTRISPCFFVRSATGRLDPQSSHCVLGVQRTTTSSFCLQAQNVLTTLTYSDSMHVLYNQARIFKRPLADKHTCHSFVVSIYWVPWLSLGLLLYQHFRSTLVVSRKSDHFQCVRMLERQSASASILQLAIERISGPCVVKLTSERVAIQSCFPKITLIHCCILHHAAAMRSQVFDIHSQSSFSDHAKGGQVSPEFALTLHQPMQLVVRIS